MRPSSNEGSSTGGAETYNRHVQEHRPAFGGISPGPPGRLGLFCSPSLVFCCIASLLCIHWSHSLAALETHNVLPSPQPPDINSKFAPLLHIHLLYSPATFGVYNVSLPRFPSFPLTIPLVSSTSLVPYPLPTSHFLLLLNTPPFPLLLVHHGESRADKQTPWWPTPH